MQAKVCILAAQLLRQFCQLYDFFRKSLEFGGHAQL